MSITMPSRPIHQQPNRGRIEIIRRIEALWTVRDDRESSLLGPQVHVVPRLGAPRSYAEPAIHRNRYAHEEINVGDYVALPEPERPEGTDEILVAAPLPRLTVAKAIVGGAAAAGQRVVTANRVSNDREQPLGPYAVQPVPGGQVDRSRILHRVGRVVAVGGVSGVIAQEVDRLLAFYVDNAQHVAYLDHSRPMRSGGHVHLGEDLHLRPLLYSRVGFTSIAERRALTHHASNRPRARSQTILAMLSHSRNVSSSSTVTQCPASTTIRPSMMTSVMSL